MSLLLLDNVQYILHEFRLNPLVSLLQVRYEGHFGKDQFDEFNLRFRQEDTKKREARKAAEAFQNLGSMSM